MLVADKPSGLLTIPTPRRESRTLTSILNEDLKEKGFSYRLHPCHRLDRETSGLIIFAKGKSVQKKVMSLFRQKEIKKTYIAFVRGSLLRDRGEIRKPIEGGSAITKYKTIVKKKDFAIVEAEPLTGRTNQIRIHFKTIGHPILGETKFAFRRDFDIKAKRLCLHAQDLEFSHPITKRYMHLHSDLPKDLVEFLVYNAEKGKA